MIHILMVLHLHGGDPGKNDYLRYNRVIHSIGDF